MVNSSLRVNPKPRLGPTLDSTVLWLNILNNINTHNRLYIHRWMRREHTVAAPPSTDSSPESASHTHSARCGRRGVQHCAPGASEKPVAFAAL